VRDFTSTRNVTISVIDTKAKVIDGEVVEQCSDDT